MFVLTGQATQRKAAAKWKVDRSTLTHICRVAKQGALDALSASLPGCPGKDRGSRAAELAAARDEIGRLRATVTEHAVALHLHRENLAGADGWARSRPRWTPSSRPACWT